MPILRCILPPKKLNHHQKKIEHPDKKLYSMGIILIPWENLKPLEKYQPPPKKSFNSTEQTQFNITEKIPTHPENISDTSQNFSTPP